MIETPYPGVVVSAVVEHPLQRVRPGSKLFWMLFAFEAFILGIVIAVVIWSLPNRTPLTSSVDHDQVRSAVLARMSGGVQDPLVTVTPELAVPESNVRGLQLGDITYYYFIEGQPSADPLSRGMVSPDQVTIVLRDVSGPAPLVIYTLDSRL